MLHSNDCLKISPTAAMHHARATCISPSIPTFLIAPFRFSIVFRFLAGNELTTLPAGLFEATGSMYLYVRLRRNDSVVGNGRPNGQLSQYLVILLFCMHVPRCSFKTMSQTTAFSMWPAHCSLLTLLNTVKQLWFVRSIDDNPDLQCIPTK